MKYHFMQLAGNCSCIGYLGKDRIRGPIDNILTTSEVIPLLMTNKLLNTLKNETPDIAERKPSWQGDCTKRYSYSFGWIVHNNPLDEKYQEELQKRINNFNNFLYNVKTKDNYYFTINLNEFDVNTKTHEINSLEIEKKLGYLKQYDILHKVIFITTKRMKNPTESLCVWSNQFDYYIKKYNLKHIVLYDNLLADPEKSNKQFLEKVDKILNHGNFAYISLLSTDNYIYFILGLNESLKEVNSEYPLYVCITKNLSKNTLDILNKVGIKTILINDDMLQPIVEHSYQHQTKTNWINALCKLYIFTLTEFDKCIFLDSDMRICKNIDHLFEKPEWSGVRDMHPEPHAEIFDRPYQVGDSLFYSGLLIYKPSMEFFNQILADLPKLLKYNVKWHDQAILAYYHQDWIKNNHLRLPCTYLLNLTVYIYEWFLKSYKKEDIYIKHYGAYKNFLPFGKKVKVANLLYDEYISYYKFLHNTLKKYDIKTIPDIQYQNLELNDMRKLDVWKTYYELVGEED